MPPRKKYEQIAYEISGLIQNGEFPLNGLAPTLDELSTNYNISRMTAQNVLKLLVAKGLVSTRRGRRSQIISQSTVQKKAPLYNKKIALIGNFDSSSHFSLAMPNKILHILRNKLTEQNNLIRCFPFSSLPGICSTEFDAYIMIDLLGVNSEHESHLKQSGRPYVIVQCSTIAEVKPNHVDLFFQSAFLRLISQFLTMGIKNFHFMNMDARAFTGEANRITRNASEIFTHPILQTLRNHGIPEEQIMFHDPGFSYEVSAELAEYLLANNLPRNSAFLTISENSTQGIYDVLTRHGWLPEQDFNIVILDPAPRAPKKLQHAYAIEINQKEIYHSIVKSLNYQLTNQENFAPGDISNASFIQRI